MAPIRPLTPKTSFKERMIKSGKSSKNLIDTRKDKNGMDAETKQIFSKMQSEKAQSPKLRDKTPMSKQNSKMTAPTKDAKAIMSKLPGTPTKFQKGNSVQASKLSKKGPKPKA